MTLADDIGAQIRAAVAGAIEDEKGTLDQIAKDGGDAAAGGFLGDVGRVTGIFSDILGSIPIIGGILSSITDPLTPIEDAGGKFGVSFGAGYLLGYLAWQLMGPFMLPVIHAVNANTTNEIFDPATAAGLAARGIVTSDYAHSEASGGGLDNPHTDLLIDAATQRPGVEQLLDMYNRGLIASTDVTDALTHHGIPSYWWPAILSSRRTLLSAADLALASLRGDMSDADIAAYTATLGVETPDMDVLIANTGEPPGLMQMLEAYRRGFMDQTRLERGIKQSRVRDEWIDIVEALRFEPMSTADAVRAVVENQLSSDDGAAIAAQNGLEPAHWQTLVDSWGRPLSHEQMMTLYYRGEVTLDQVQQAFRESDLKDKYIDMAVSLGRKLIPERQIVAMLQHGIVDDKTAATMLQELGYNSDDAGALIALGVHEHGAQVKQLSKTDILAMYRDALMTREQASDALEALGFPAQTAAWELELSDAKAAATILRTHQAAIKASLRAHHLTEDQAVTQLTALGVDHAQAVGLVDQWVTERGVATRTLSEAQIVKAVKAQVLTPAQGLTRLQSDGYSPDDSAILLESNGINVG